MPAKPMSEKICEKCGRTYKSKGRHTRDYHPELLSQKSPSAASIQSPSTGGDIQFQDIEKVMADKKKELTTPISTTVSKPSTEILGIGGFFITIAEWLNATITKNPEIVMNEKIAAKLEKQFNDAFGAYIKPLTAFAISMFFVFGVPILLNLFGKEVVEKFIKKFKEGFSKKLGGKDNVQISDNKNI